MPPTQPVFKDLRVPKAGERIRYAHGEPVTPAHPIIPFIEGDGVGRDIWKAAVRVFDAAVAAAYKGERKIEWLEVYAGDKAQGKYGVYLPDDTIEAIRHFGVAIKGPLTTPVGTGIRSLNVTMRQTLDLYSCIRPVRFLFGAPSPMRHPEDVDFVIFRENTEDLYAGIEWKAESPEAKKLIAFINDMLSKDPSTKGKRVDEAAGIGIKPISRYRTQRNMRRALKHAIKNGINDVCIVHKGNIMKYTEGAFRDWCYELAVTEFRGQVVTEEELHAKHGGKLPEGKILVKDRIADNAFQQILLYPQNYRVLVMPNLEGDLLSDAAAAQIGGLGIAPGANIGDEAAVFEATHGTAPTIADKNIANPSAMISSGALMFEHIGWPEVRKLLDDTLRRTVNSGTLTADFADQIEGATSVGTGEFADALIKNLAASEPVPEPKLARKKTVMKRRK
ncbi:MAG: isocitrate dehydrogenase (NADP(+)) [Planctomycetes bacterium]|nr:isocitrate dehydrogenase (NADP(+)) [Planctomycetota bacterium]